MANKEPQDIAPRLPQNIEAERAVVGAILISPKQLDRLPDLKPEYFFFAPHYHIVKRVLDMREKAMPIDLVTLAAELSRVGDLEAAGGAAYLADVTDGVPKVSNVEYYLRIVREAWTRRQVAHSAEMVKALALDSSENLDDLKLRISALAAAITPDPAERIKAVTATEVSTMEVLPKEFLVEGLFETKTINEVFARKGVGKTFLTMSLANAIAVGGSCLKWKASKPRKVGYLDGELGASDRKERFAFLGITGANLQILSTDTLDRPFPSLATPEGQRITEDAFDPDIEALFIDNLAALAPSSQEHETEQWTIIQGWLHDLKRRGISTIFNNHAGHAGWSRGTTKREDLCSTVIKLQHPANYSPAELCRFELSFDKNRSGVDASPIECVLTTDLQGRGLWTWRDCEDVRAKQVKELRASNLTLRDIAKETGIPLSTVNRLLKKNG